MADKEESAQGSGRPRVFDNQRVNDAFNRAWGEHWSTKETVIPGFSTLHLDRNIKLNLPVFVGGSSAYANLTLHEGLYFLNQGDQRGGIAYAEKHKGAAVWLYCIDRQTAILDGLTIDRAQGREETKLKMRLVPVRSDYREEPVSHVEAVLHTRLQDLADEGKKAEVNKLLKEIYRVEKKPGRVEEGAPTAKQDLQPVREYVQGLSKLSNPASWAGIESTGGKRLDVSGRVEEPVYTIVRLIDEDEETRRKPLFRGTEESTCSAAHSLYRAGRRVFTAADVAKLALLQDKPSRAQVARVDEQLEAMAGRRVSIDWTEEARGRELKFEGEKVESFKYTSYLLPLETIEAETANGKKSKCYRFIAPPILYRHDMETGQIAAFNTEKLKAATAGVSATERNILIRDYLLRRIARMKRGGASTASEIRYESVMEAAHLESDAKGKNRAAVKKAVNDYLAGFVREKIINGYAEYKSKSARAAVGVKVSVANCQGK